MGGNLAEKAFIFFFFRHFRYNIFQKCFEDGALRVNFQDYKDQ